MRAAAIALILASACASGPHQRVQKRELPGRTHSIDGILPKPVELFVPRRARELLIHLHGASFVVNDAAIRTTRPLAAMTVHIGAGSSAYEQPFSDPSLFPRLVAAAEERAAARFDRIWITAFSAGYGGVRALLRDDAAMRRIDGVLLLDGLHTAYVPDGQPGVLDHRNLEPFVRLAERSARGEVAFVFTHSEIVPGTYASTTETADALIAALGMNRKSAIRRAAVGMRQLSEARRGRFHVLGFAGKTAPDHIDHLHALATFLELLWR